MPYRPSGELNSAMPIHVEVISADLGYNVNFVFVERVIEFKWGWNMSQLNESPSVPDRFK